jgi:hypothetical protein
MLYKKRLYNIVILRSKSKGKGSKKNIQKNKSSIYDLRKHETKKDT